jgi:hypothetical protein
VRTAPRDPGRNRMILGILAGSALLVVAAVAAFLLLGIGNDGEAGTQVGDKFRADGGTFQTVPAAPNFMLNGRKLAYRHIPNGGVTLPPGYRYSTTPPTSGIHSDATVIFGIYDEAVPTVSTVHNLEHGAVVIRYGPDVPASEIDKLREFYLDDPNGLVVAPMPGLGDKIALTAWTFDQDRQNSETYEGEGHIATTTRFDEDAFKAFVDAFRGHGAEPFKVSDLQPGGG